ncbi:MAG: Uncharacterized protein AUREO_017040 [Aureobasidium pullulans]|uniref:C2H2-type domain-containing protein n=1 Tax=Aureobasidium pullulans TaxID=5580 RepID=A0A1A7MPB7_AURPU|nr:MAG: Uncharacterized protein AUREO_017040 [Aureobasidium pullulans]THV87998.1 hypothetical protein D6D29_00232 [Aureobasidium pullulans]THW23809.1 hypothetical protein D6D24_00336 [Aureobasidium pullulans]THW30264.1 hypothetical protein D6D23_00291 [Aureobasidium pullulans]THX08662.1 hypothetical protein D6D18_01594 [Aureobasidium pullulans]
MQHHYHWSMVEPSIGHGSDPYYHPGYPLEDHRVFESGHWRSPVETGKHHWTELPQSVHAGPAYPEFPSPLASSSGLHSFGPPILKQEQDTTSDCKWSPTLTNSSLISNTSSLPILPSMPLADCTAHVTGVESPVFWPASNQFYHVPDHASNQLSPFWHDTRVKTDESMSMSCSNSRPASSEEHRRRPQHPEAEVQALLDRPKRVKTTAENARFYCNECDKGFQRVYNLRSHMLKHEASREKIQCSQAGCNKSFDRKTDLGRHNRSVHLHQRDHKCVLCGNLFARKDTLVRHIEGSCSKRTGVDRKRPKDSSTPTMVDVNADEC